MAAGIFIELEKHLDRMGKPCYIYLISGKWYFYA